MALQDRAGTILDPVERKRARLAQSFGSARVDEDTGKAHIGPIEMEPSLGLQVAFALTVDDTTEPGERAALIRELVHFVGDRMTDPDGGGLAEGVSVRTCATFMDTIEILVRDQVKAVRALSEYPNSVTEENVLDPAIHGTLSGVRDWWLTHGPIPDYPERDPLNRALEAQESSLFRLQDLPRSTATGAGYVTPDGSVRPAAEALLDDLILEWGPDDSEAIAAAIADLETALEITADHPDPELAEKHLWAAVRRSLHTITRYADEEPVREGEMAVNQVYRSLRQRSQTKPGRGPVPT